MQSNCPECNADVKFPNGVEIGEIMDCDDCGAELEVKGVNPPSVALAPEEEEDWGE